MRLHVKTAAAYTRVAVFVGTLQLDITRERPEARFLERRSTLDPHAANDGAALKICVSRATLEFLKPPHEVRRIDAQRPGKSSDVVK
jgi:hypothetical protein